MKALEGFMQKTGLLPWWKKLIMSFHEQETDLYWESARSFHALSSKGVLFVLIGVGLVAGASMGLFPISYTITLPICFLASLVFGAKTSFGFNGGRIGINTIGFMLFASWYGFGIGLMIEILSTLMIGAGDNYGLVWFIKVLLVTLSVVDTFIIAIILGEEKIPILIGGIFWLILITVSVFDLGVKQSMDTIWLFATKLNIDLIARVGLVSLFAILWTIIFTPLAPITMYGFGPIFFILMGTIVSFFTQIPTNMRMNIPCALVSILGTGIGIVFYLIARQTARAAFQKERDLWTWFIEKKKKAINKAEEDSLFQEYYEKLNEIKSHEDYPLS